MKNYSGEFSFNNLICCLCVQQKENVLYLFPMHHKGLTHRANELPKLLLLSMKHSWAALIIHGTDFHHFWQTKLPNNLINGLFI